MRDRAKKIFPASQGENHGAAPPLSFSSPRKGESKKFVPEGLKIVVRDYDGSDQAKDFLMAALAFYGRPLPIGDLLERYSDERKFRS